MVTSLGQPKWLNRGHYYTLMAVIADNNATQEDYQELTHILGLGLPKLTSTLLGKWTPVERLIDLPWGLIEIVEVMVTPLSIPDTICRPTSPDSPVNPTPMKPANPMKLKMETMELVPLNPSDF